MAVGRLDMGAGQQTALGGRVCCDARYAGPLLMSETITLPHGPRRIEMRYCYPQRDPRGEERSGEVPSVASASGAPSFLPGFRPREDGVAEATEGTFLRLEDPTV